VGGAALLHKGPPRKAPPPAEVVAAHSAGLQVDLDRYSLLLIL